MGLLDGKVALITGVARGQGRSHALALAREGADIVGCDLLADAASVPYALSRPEDLEETRRGIEELDRRCLLTQADVRDPDAMRQLVADGLSELGRLDIVVPNAGIWAAAPLAEMTDEQWRTVIDINLTGVFNTVRAAVQPMIAQGSGRIVATASTAARAGMGNFGNYVATKWGVIGMVKTFAIELAPHNITANAICPAAVRTDMMYENKALYRLFRPDLEDPQTADVEQTIMTALHKLPTPWIEASDISEVVVFLASDKARFISGTAIDVTAGLSADWGA
jgi:SDR family mycofactocin-dependent oxidoreductase